MDWVRRDGMADEGYINHRNVAMLPGGALAVEALVSSTVTFDPGGAEQVTFEGGNDRSVLAQYTPDGELASATHEFVVTAGSYSRVDAMTATPGGQLLIAGSTSTGAVQFAGGGEHGTIAHSGDQTTYIAWLGAGGAPVRVHTWVQREKARIDVKQAHVLPSGDALVIGSYRGQVMFATDEARTSIAAPDGSYAGIPGDIFLLLLRSSGELGWLSTVAGAGDDFPTELVVVENGDVMVAGGYQRETSVADADGSVARLVDAREQAAFVARYSPGGKLRWARSVGGSSVQNYCAGASIAELTDSTILASGCTRAGKNGERASAYLVAWNAEGDELWQATQAHDEGVHAGQVIALPGGDALVLGSYWHPGPVESWPELPVGKPNDKLLSRVGPNGTRRWTRRVLSPRPDLSDGSRPAATASTWAHFHEGKLTLVASIDAGSDFEPGQCDELEVDASEFGSLLIARYSVLEH